MIIGNGRPQVCAMLITMLCNSCPSAKDRDKDVVDGPQGIANEPMQPPKRPRIVRNRYPSQNQPTGGGALARKLLEATLSEDKIRERKDRQS